MQLPLAKSLQREALGGSVILLVALDVAISKSMDVAQQLEFAYHPSLFTKGNTCGGRLVRTRVEVGESGWMEKESYKLWFINMFLAAVKHRQRVGQW